MRKTIGIAVISACIGGLATYAFAEKQPHMHAAIKHLEQAKGALEKAEPDKGGHRVKAIELVDQAIKEVREGIEFDNKH